MMKNIFFTTFLLTSLSAVLFAQSPKAEVDCLILEDENSIICKYINNRSRGDKTITFEWLDPKGEISRTRNMVIPAGHGSVYDFRYIEGREIGIWTFKVIDGKKILKTEFEIK